MDEIIFLRRFFGKRKKIFACCAEVLHFIVFIGGAPDNGAGQRNQLIERDEKEAKLRSSPRNRKKLLPDCIPCVLLAEFICTAPMDDLVETDVSKFSRL